jgi:hypothetical protein
MTFVRPPREPDLEALIGALPTEDGGRRTPMLSGYRPSHDFRLSGELDDATHEYPDTGQVAPGETERAKLWLLAPDRQIERLFAGKLFTVQEGPRVVGNGRILRVINDHLERRRPIRFELDGSRVDSLVAFYEEVSRVLIPGEFWGRNLDAFNDVLRGGFGTPDDGFQFVWRDHAISRQRLGYPETARQLELRLARCHPSNRGRAHVELEQARAGVGPTVFDWLVEIIRCHGPGGEEASDAVELVLE